MRNTIRTVALLAALAGAVTYGWRWLFPSDEAQIQAVLERIADALSGDADGDVNRLARAASLRNQFDPEVTIDPGPPFGALRGRDTVISTAATAHSAVRNLELSFADVTVLVDSVRRAATANLTAEARFNNVRGGRGADARALEVAFTRIDGAWVVSSVTAARPLRRFDQP